MSETPSTRRTMPGRKWLAYWSPCCGFGRDEFPPREARARRPYLYHIRTSWRLGVFVVELFHSFRAQPEVTARLERGDFSEVPA